MNRIASVLTGFLFLAALAATPATAQETPKFDVSAGYSFVAGNQVVTSQSINLNGASGSVSYNYNRFLGLVFDLGTYYNGNVASTGRTLSVTTYLFGPRFSYRKNEKVTPFGQVLLGGGYAGGTLYTTSLGGGAAPLGAQNSFAMTAGGGLDWNAHPRIAVRLFQAEYLRTQFNNGINSNQNNFRFSAGVVFHFGKR
jgi:opacity protein-like surface antigen